MVQFFRKLSLTHGWIKTSLISVFLIWMIANLVGTLNDQSLNPWGLTSALVKFGLILAILALIIFKTRLWKLIKEHQNIFIAILIFLALVWQIVVIKSTSAPIGWDVGSIHGSLFDPKSASIYLSQNPNNTFLFFFQYLILKYFNASPTWLNVNFINLICFDLSLLINVFSVRLLKKDAVKPLIIIQAVLMFSFIQIIVPYSDVMVLPFVSLIILGFAILKKTKTNTAKISGLLTFSLASLTAYLMKPSAIIVTIAILIGFFLQFLQIKFTKKNVLTYGLSLFIFLAIFIIGVKSFNTFTYHNDFVIIQKDKGQPVNHFISMGITGTGGWSAEQGRVTYTILKTTRERSSYSNKIIKKRLKEQGIFGMIQFFIAKNYSNTSDGSFGWYRGDGPYTDTSKPTKNLMQNIYYQNGKYYNDYKLIVQVLWILLLSLIILGIGYLSEFSQILRLGALGGLTFLLIFEGGRSRYLIQFLPMFLMLATLSFGSAKIMIKNINATIKSTLNKAQ
ncbi:hypothetical protein [Fructilactobacillus florum]|uniref:hypothetical protein n=1 Tax=Fructilactobacillus florum TaxID=640331 RepID=UPI00028CD446|nr:hypothetical protein [Fructilactobacillus florum]EKK20424.1 Integral membrane protein [Fructilactobacillus florum 2F]